MKQLITILLLFSCIACSKSSDDPAPVPTPAPAPVVVSKQFLQGLWYGKTATIKHFIFRPDTLMTGPVIHFYSYTLGTDSVLHAQSFSDSSKSLTIQLQDVDTGMLFNGILYIKQ
jgi:hypothetical protein